MVKARVPEKNKAKRIDNGSFLIRKLFKNDLRMSILLLLRLHERLNVTEVSNYLNKNKATVGRHLKALKKANILRSEEEDTNRTINPLYYSINKQINNFLEYEKSDAQMKNRQENVKNIKEKYKKNPKFARRAFQREFIVMKTVLKLLQQAIRLLNPFMDQLKEKLEDEELDVDYLSDYLLIDNHLSLWHFPLSENVLEEFYELHYEFREKVEKLRDKCEGDKSLIFVDSILPLQELLRLSGNVDIE